MLLDETFQKIFVSVLLILFGLLIGQGATFIRVWWKNRKLKKSLFVELQDIRKQLPELSRSYAREIQVFSLGGMSFDVSSKLSNRVFEKHYTDIFLKLNHSQRDSYERIYGLVEIINLLIEQESKTGMDFDEEKLNQFVAKKGGISEAQYSNVCQLGWCIDFHLRNRKSPDFGEFKGENHKRFLKYMEQVTNDISMIKQGAKDLDRNEMKKYYREEDFQ